MKLQTLEGRKMPTRHSFCLCRESLPLNAIHSPQH
jgi:hypothetical protein